VATLFESLSEAITPDVVGQIGKTTGLDSSLVSTGLGTVGPLITGALAGRASSPQGLGGLMDMLPASGGGLGSIIGSLAGSGAEASKEGGFLGIGGTRISDAERAAIDQIKSAIGRS
jgi:uncharacterized protein YidB (DUF937 family)